MTAAEFRHWLELMKTSGRARSDAECGRLLGKTADTVIAYKNKGTDRTIDLACRALWMNVDGVAFPWQG